MTGHRQAREPPERSPREAPERSPQVMAGDAPDEPSKRLNTGGMLYGTLVAAAALAVGSGRGDTAGDIIDAMASTLVIYWLAHICTAMVSGRRPGSAAPLRRDFRGSARHESPILLGGLPPLVVFAVLILAGVGIPVAVLSALGSAIGMFALDGFLAARQVGVKGWRLAMEASAAAFFGVLVALLMVSLH